MKDRSLDLQDFLDATSDSAKRTRTIMILLVVACVLALVGFVNSLRSGWMLERLQKVSDPNNAYVVEKLGKPDLKDTDARYNNFHAAISRGYVENALTVRVPFFGVAFDINDLGLLGGFGFIVVLTLLRFSIRTEIVSLRLAFKAATKAAEDDRKQLETFYDLLAMRQVLTLPHMEDRDIEWVANRSLILRAIPKLICFLPIVVYSLVAGHDYVTRDIGNAINPLHTKILLTYTGLFWAVILALSIWCFLKLRKIDSVWEEYWLKVSPSKRSESDDVQIE
ncbi:MAG TPA: hypothetical protein VE732_03070 [Nitrososphaera sp.]|nr:hypothetical protein [Nitrososphaera sp.]